MKFVAMDYNTHIFEEAGIEILLGVDIEICGNRCNIAQSFWPPHWVVEADDMCHTFIKLKWDFSLLPISEDHVRDLTHNKKAFLSKEESTPYVAAKVGRRVRLYNLTR